MCITKASTCVFHMYLIGMMQTKLTHVLHLAYVQSVRRTRAKLGDVRRCEAARAIVDDCTICT